MALPHLYPSATPQPFSGLAGQPVTRKRLTVGVADMQVSGDPKADLITFSLGSCVGVAIYDPITRVGGLLHAMLPDSAIKQGDASLRPHMFVDTGLPALFRAVYALGGQKSRLLVRCAGGAEFLDKQRLFNIGSRNLEALFALLARNGVPVHAQAVGGHDSRTLTLDLSNGEVTVATAGKPTLKL